MKQFNSVETFANKTTIKRIRMSQRNIFKHKQYKLVAVYEEYTKLTPKILIVLETKLHKDDQRFRQNITVSYFNFVK